MALCASCTATVSTTERCPMCGEDALLRSTGPGPVQGRYRLDRVLGRGPGRTTYQGTLLPDGLRVVLKEAMLPRKADLKVRELVKREARVLQILQHPQIPLFVDHWITEDTEPRAWLVLEYIEGTDLERWLHLRPFEEAEVVGVMLELCEVMGYLHKRDPPILHRDLKPANVLRCPDGRLMLLDFGAARDGISKQGATTVVGTWGYMAPEQHQGDATPRSDLYGLGALAVALLTGRDLSSLIGKGLTLEWHEHANVSMALTALLDDLLAQEPKDRPASIEEVQGRLSAIPLAPKPAETMPLVLTLVVAAGSVALVLTVGLVWLVALAAAAQLVAG